MIFGGELILAVNKVETTQEALVDLMMDTVNKDVLKETMHGSVS